VQKDRPQCGEALALWVTCLLLVVVQGLAQPQPAGGTGLEAPRVFLDCGECDFSYVRREITFVNWVRDPRDADVHVLVTDQHTASGGREYELEFIGQGNYAGRRDTLVFVAMPDRTEDEERQGRVRSLKLGLVPYAADTPMGQWLSVSLEQDLAEAAPAVPADDPWDSWVFEIQGNGWLDKEKQQSEYTLEGEFEADRITEAWRIRLDLEGRFEKEKFESGGTTITSSSHRKELDGRIAGALGPHWSAGIRGRVNASTFDN
jgi:hypothetical protein